MEAAAKIRIVSRWSPSTVLFECDAPDGLESGLHMRHALEQATKANANLSGANLSGAYLRGANLSDANLSDAYLSGANLSGAYLSDANLSDANLSGAYLRGANLSGANLSGANLSGAYLRDADLSGANLSDANLSGANLSGAYLRDADLSGANLRDALKLAGARPYFSIGHIGSRHDNLVAYITDQGLRLQAGCFFGTREEFVAKLDAEHGDNQHGVEYHAALAMAETHAMLWAPVVEAPVEAVAEAA